MAARLPRPSRCIGVLVLGVQLAAAGSCAAAGPQTVYRCGPEGREFSQKPCTDGTLLPAVKAPGVAEREAARQVAEADARLAEKLARERQAREADTPAAAGFDRPAPRPLAATTSAARKSGKKKPPTFYGPSGG